MDENILDQMGIKPFSDTDELDIDESEYQPKRMPMHKGNRNRHLPGGRATEETLQHIATILEHRNLLSDGKYSFADFVAEKAAEEAERIRTEHHSVYVQQLKDSE